MNNFFKTGLSLSKPNSNSNPSPYWLTLLGRFARMMWKSSSKPLHNALHLLSQINVPVPESKRFFILNENSDSTVPAVFQINRLCRINFCSQRVELWKPSAFKSGKALKEQLKSSLRVVVDDVIAKSFRKGYRHANQMRLHCPFN